MRKICFVTGTRAEYGLLSRLMRLVADDKDLQLQIIATNMHLMPKYGETYKEIEADGFHIDRRVYMNKPTDDATGIIVSMAEEMRGMNDAIAELNPDILVILGDRYEMLAVATVAMLRRVPIAHLHGGEISEGAVDDSIRHSITKMSSLHFTSTEEYRRRVIQLGEQPDRVFYVGAIGVENLKRVSLMSKQDLEVSLNFTFSGEIVMVTYHPVTLGNRSTKDEIDDFLLALDAFPTLKVLFTMPNSDQGGEVIRQAIEDYCRWNSDRCSCYSSLGLKRYLSALRYVTVVAGNSSSGLLEVPSVHVPTLNIGERQKGRTHGASVYDCASDTVSIIAGLKTVLSEEFREMACHAVNPYEKENTAQTIFDVIATYPLDKLHQKIFYNL